MRSLKKARRLLDYTQDQLAKMVGVTTQHVRNLEAGRSKPRVSTKEKFEKKLGSINWIETWENGKLNQKKV